MTGEIAVVVETIRGEVTEASYATLAAGRRLADDLGTQLWAVLMGHNLQKLAGSLGVADRLLGVEHEALAEFNPDAFLQAAEAVFRQRTPRVALFGHTAMGTDIACGMAHGLKLPIVVSCRALGVADGQPQYASLLCGGKIIAEGPLPGPSCVVTVMPGGYRSEEAKRDRTVPCEMVAAPEALGTARTHFRQYIDPPSGDVDIAKQPILVSVGRGIQNKDNLALAERLAQALGGVVSGSRPVIDQGWLPTTRLVGKSGKQVRPKLYLALGISGAPEHLEGVPSAELMIGINTDPKAPIFEVAHYGATCNALEVLPILLEKLQRS
jgi:electron transfer flavoprotein alpha subunit